MSKKINMNYKDSNKYDYKKEILKKKLKSDIFTILVALYIIAFSICAFIYLPSDEGIKELFFKYIGSIIAFGFGISLIVAVIFERVKLNKEKDDYFSDFETMIRIANTGKIIYENEFFKIVDSVFIDKSNAENIVYLDEIYSLHDSSFSAGTQSFEETYHLVLHTARGIGTVKLPHVTQKEAENIVKILLQYTPNAHYGYNRSYVKKMKQKKKELDASRNLNSYETAFKDNHYIPSDDSNEYEYLLDDRKNYDSQIYDKNTFKKKAKLIFHDTAFATSFIIFVIAFIIFVISVKTVVVYNIDHINYDESITPNLDELKEGRYIGGKIIRNFGCIESPYINKYSKNYYIIPYGGKVIFFMATNDDVIKRLDTQNFMDIHYPIIGGRDYTYTYEFVGKIKKLDKGQLEKSYDVIKHRCPDIKDIDKDVLPYYIAPDYSMSKEGVIIAIVTGIVSIITLIIMVISGIKINKKIKMRESGQRL
ncbi:hypothetical protein SAMN02745111_02342 [Eubacterium uniforme]|uniref:Uncharacterized protein n=2 Tax=Eubacterium uniforme TaxID=39495 RepID=A0A1T4W593_9FIRM|nr:hypothetical protein SAMN02745111_02342 [Eubacterium uniforme]